MVKNMLVVNFFGGPGCGKSTTAAWLFSELKQRRISCEYVTEFAKDLTWEENKNALACQEYVFGNQSYRMHIVKDKVDVLITDSPLPLSIVYNHGRLAENEFNKIVWQVFNMYDNLNIYLTRPDVYEQTGRNESAEEAFMIDSELLNILCAGDIGTVFGFDVTGNETKAKILELVLNGLES